MAEGDPGPLRVAIVSDTHLSERAPEALENWGAVLGWSERLQPDLVLHLGDLTLFGSEDPGELAAARQQLERLPAPWAVLPGNHDLGDNVGVRPASWAIDGSRREAWLDVLGSDRWTLDVGGWTLIGLDAQLVGWDAADDEQWRWLEAALGARPKERPILVAVHKPVAGPAAELARTSGARYLPAAGRAKLASLLRGRRVPLVLSGHVHQFRTLEVERSRHVWAPTSWAVVPEHRQPTLGRKVCGVLAADLHASGRAEVRLEIPPGLRQMTLGVEAPDPYVHSA